jgi:hypothetical protein
MVGIGVEIFGLLGLILAFGMMLLVVAYLLRGIKR